MAEVGDIFYVDWGYDQTNADFYQVVAKNPKGVKVRHIKKNIIESSPQSMTGSATPIKDSFDGPIKNKRFTYTDRTYGEGFKTEYGYAFKWKGNPIAVSWYG